MRYITYISVAILTFALGFSLSSLLRTSTSANVEMQSVAELRNDDFHRLFEAAQMSKDEDLRAEVLGRLECADEDGSLRRRRFYGDDVTLCQEFEPTAAELAPEPYLYTSYSFKYVPVFLQPNPYYDIIKTHGEWSKKNMAFIRSVADPKAARLYIKDRLERE